MRLNAEISAVVVGGASGLGEATVRHLRELGVRCAIFDRDEVRGQAVANETGALFQSCDVTSSASVDEAFDRAKGGQGVARILVNCAGTGTATKVAARKRDTGEIVGHTIELFERVVQINLIGSFRTMVRFSTDLLEEAPLDAGGERGVIINTSSIAAQDGQQGQAAYSASKGGILGLTLPAARDLAREGIRVAAILPGFFATPLTGRATEAAQQNLISASLFPNRGGRPHEFATLVAHICANEMINAECIRLDAGARLPKR
jgi:NAD(P)-dependent dehydrogenase (short-subunit alcohol dehydrogenase family)